jgi:transcription elongation GreA/GreB family factor
MANHNKVRMNSKIKCQPLSDTPKEPSTMVGEEDWSLQKGKGKVLVLPNKLEAKIRNFIS